MEGNVKCNYETPSILGKSTFFIVMNIISGLPTPLQKKKKKSDVHIPLLPRSPHSRLPHPANKEPWLVKQLISMPFVRRVKNVIRESRQSPPEECNVKGYHRDLFVVYSFGGLV